MTRKTLKQQVEEIWDSLQEKIPEPPSHEPYIWPIKNQRDSHKDCHRENHYGEDWDEL